VSRIAWPDLPSLCVVARALPTDPVALVVAQFGRDGADRLLRCVENSRAYILTVGIAAPTVVDMSIETSTRHFAGHFFADATVCCDFCGTKAETQGACGAEAQTLAGGIAKAHAKVFQKWTETTVPVREGRKTYALVRDACPACAATRVAS
jgi:hypothetical protein